MAPFGNNILMAFRLGLARAWNSSKNSYNFGRYYMRVNGIIVPEH